MRHKRESINGDFAGGLVVDSYLKDGRSKQQLISDAAEIFEELDALKLPQLLEITERHGGDSKTLIVKYLQSDKKEARTFALRALVFEKTGTNIDEDPWKDELWMFRRDQQEGSVARWLQDKL